MKSALFAWALMLAPGLAQAAPVIAEMAPPLAPAAPVADKGATLEVPGGRIWYWDTGGSGRPLLLAHPGTGSALIWGYQRAALAKAGYRVIAWSRLGFHGSIRNGEKAQGDVADLEALVKTLKIERFDALGSAAGGGVMMRYASAYPQRIRSLIMACSLGDIDDAGLNARLQSLRPAAFMQLPADFRELSPSYRAANPDGVKAWLALEETANEGQKAAAPGGGMPPPSGNRAAGASWEAIRRFPFPVLWLGGDADLFVPPPILELYHQRLPGSEIAIIQGAGHSAYWERPEDFNRTIRAFLARH